LWPRLLDVALHDYLSEILAAHNVEVVTIGVERRRALVTRTETLARSLGPFFLGLRFEEATIHKFFEDSAKRPSLIDVLVALHACDTATDDALFYGISGQSKVIVTAPCCHRELRKQIDKEFTYSAKPVVVEAGVAVSGGGLWEIMRHGIYRERQNEMVTDSLRTLVLERFGYKCTVMEFVGGEHTAKNVMIVAVKQHIESSDVESIEARIRDLTRTYGLRRQTLLSSLGLQHLLVH